VSEAGTLAEAFSALSQGPDWVRLYLMLPDGCGSRIIKKVADDRMPSKVCVITGCGPEKLDQVRAMGPQFVFKKPLDVCRLLDVLAGEVE